MCMYHFANISLLYNSVSGLLKAASLQSDTWAHFEKGKTVECKHCDNKLKFYYLKPLIVNQLPFNVL